MEETRARFGVAVLIDCHSMPSALSVPDIVLGDRYGASAAPRLTAHAEAAFLREGFGGAQYALCRRPQHRALWPRRIGLSCAAGGDQSRAVSGRRPHRQAAAFDMVRHAADAGDAGPGGDSISLLGRPDTLQRRNDGPGRVPRFRRSLQGCHAVSVSSILRRVAWRLHLARTWRAAHTFPRVPALTLRLRWITMYRPNAGDQNGTPALPRRITAKRRRLPPISLRLVGALHQELKIDPYFTAMPLPRCANDRRGPAMRSQPSRSPEEQERRTAKKMAAPKSGQVQGGNAQEGRRLRDQGSQYRAATICRNRPLSASANIIIPDKTPQKAWKNLSQLPDFRLSAASSGTCATQYNRHG